MTDKVLGIEQGHGEKGERMPKNTSMVGVAGNCRGWGAGPCLRRLGTIPGVKTWDANRVQKGWEWGI